MTKLKLTKMIFQKICSLAIIAMSIAYTPMQINFGASTSVSAIIFMIVISIFFFIPGWMLLLQTNDPLSRYNPFSINRKWTGKWESSLEDNPGQLFDLDKADESDIKKEKRNKKIDNILK